MPAPYLVTMPLRGTGFTADYVDNSQTLGGHTMHKGTDIGPLIPHIGTPSILLAIEIPLSASKSHFGAAKYMDNRKQVALAVAGPIHVNLNCGTPVPSMTNVVLAFSTHQAGMTWADIGAGIAGFLVDAAIQSALGALGGGVGNRLGPSMYNTLGPRALSGLARNLGVGLELMDSALKYNARAKFGLNLAEKIAETVFGFGVGGPLGMSLGNFTNKLFGVDVTTGGQLSSLLGKGAEAAGRGLGGLLDGPDDAVKQYAFEKTVEDHGGA